MAKNSFTVEGVKDDKVAAAVEPGLIAKAVKPEKYRLFAYKLGRIIGHYWPDPKKGVPVIDVRPDEAVYIGPAVARREDDGSFFSLN